MSALAFVRCAGAPRDLGLDQGRAARDAIRAAVEGARPGALAARAARDLERFFPHHAERAQGLSLGAGVSQRALTASLEALLGGDGGCALALASERTGGGALLGRSLAGPLLLRASAPDNDYRSLELAPAASPAAWLGVNEHGLAATAVARPASAAQLDGCAAPAQLLVQDVLQRFDAVEKAVDWALRRPAGGCASLLLADATGRVAAVAIEGRARRLIGAGETALATAPALDKSLAAARLHDVDAVARLLAENAGGLVAVADPAGRRLGVASAGGALAWHALGPR